MNKSIMCIFLYFLYYSYNQHAGNPKTKIPSQSEGTISSGSEWFFGLVWVGACGYSIGLDHQDIGFSKAFNGYSDTGFQKDKKKLTDIGFIGPDNYGVVFV